MRLAVLADIHGNLTALDAALQDLESVGSVDYIWVLGDLAAMGARPAACVQRVQELVAQHDEGQVKVIGGNADRYLITGERLPSSAAGDEDSFRQLSRTWQDRDTVLNWAVSQLSYDDYNYLKGLLGKEITLKVDGYGRVIGYHAIPGDDEFFLTPETPDEIALDAVLDREGRLGIGGHIHRQMDRDLGRWRLVNVGSVGMSFEVPGQAQWGLFTFENGAVTVDLRRVTYNVDDAAIDLQNAGHPLPEWFLRYLRPA